MGQTFVYNTGESTPPPGTLEKTYGMFFDGTGNNLRNTEIRKKVQKEEEYANQNIKENVATDDEKRIYRKKGLTWLRKEKKNNSYNNDFSNVARMYLCSSIDYRIYTEGIGTENKESDNLLPGQAFGTGATGIHEKVKKGCDSLAKEINKIVKKNTQKISLTLDVFGFSRGAAAARHFVYEIKKKAYKPWQKPIPRGYGTTLLLSDSFGDELSEADLIDGQLPPHGRLGLALVRLGVAKEMVKRMEVYIRFVGLYDTVASYGINHEKGVEQLKLHELGGASQVVHFTAMDEHRENFALTPTQVGITKNFPGVHSDIGGGYDSKYGKANHDDKNDEYIDELEVDDYISHIYQKGDPLVQFGKTLVDEGWYFENELKIHTPLLKPYRHLSGTRKYVRKEYSYLILHYMEYYAKKLLVDNEFMMSTTTEYPIKDALLLNAKIRLDDYVKKEGEEWKLIPHPAEQQIDDDVENEHIEKSVSSTLLSENSVEKEDQITYGVYEMEELMIHPYNKWLKDLRHHYLHWSADYNRTGMSPTKDRKRKIIE